MLPNTKKGIVGLLVAFLFAFTMFAIFSVANADINKEINYQGKLLNSNGSAVTDGSYNMRFKLYTVASGGTAVWTETWCYSSDSGVTCTGAGTNNKVSITDGLFSLMLGSTTSLTSVNFNQTLYLGVEIGGTSNSSFTADGEMTPRKRIGAVPQAIESERVGGLNATQFLRSDADNATTSASTYFYIKQSGVGDIANFFDGSTEVFSVVDGGNVGMGTTTPFGILSIGDRAGATSFIIGSSTATTLIVDSSGRLGIGTSAPGALLDIQGAAEFGTGNVNLIDSTGKISGISSSYFASLNGSELTSLSATNISGTLGVAQGGTNIASYSTGDLLYATGATTLGKLAIGGANTVFTSSGSAPQWSTSLTLSGAVSGSYITATDASATSTFDGGLVVGTTGLVYQKATGNVGIGTVNPDSLLHINSSTAGKGAHIGSAFVGNWVSGGGTAIFTNYAVSTVSGSFALLQDSVGITYLNSTGGLFLRTANIDRLTISGGGNVGIGTTTPNWRLHIAGTRPFSVLSDTGAGTDAKHWFTTSQGGNFYIGTSSDALNATSTYVTIKNGGYFGIGTTEPGRKLDILDAVTTGGQLRLSYSNSVYTDFLVNSVGDLTVSLLGATGNDILFNNTNSNMGANLFICESLACPDVADKIPNSAGGNLILENALIFGYNKFSIQATTSSSTVLHITDSTGTVVATFDEY